MTVTEATKQHNAMSPNYFRVPGSLKGDKIKSTTSSLGCLTMDVAMSLAACISPAMLPVSSMANINVTSPWTPMKVSKTASPSSFLMASRNCLAWLVDCLFLRLFVLSSSIAVNKPWPIDWRKNW